MTDSEWALIEPLLPVAACHTPSGGLPGNWPRREIVDGIRFVVDNESEGATLAAAAAKCRAAHQVVLYVGRLRALADDLRLRPMPGRCRHRRRHP
ncbi:transposase [Streptomyces sp. NPDC090306]|uniref:transposase n=1 Tax=Streptomyces sp. NPDC090306 TaxID=3365961 RepID=UPI0038092880